ncbi:hypothetical protein KKY_1912 [Pelagibacterium halotolerans B2]|uniref:Uncharacterized protein n=1 Tax=Pelagibacterium halotolerans (strain DSM 22347 / JCM 15775 / CGMCC 1.7692 / B2) TaxID=1082931 RepID=G4REV2_PELHB|nr:hypothetical protein KKY_1912 [Pelagibacterium halotolerans B2]
MACYPCLNPPIPPTARHGRAANRASFDLIDFAWSARKLFFSGPSASLPRKPGERR